MNSLCKICGLFVSKANFARHVEIHGQNKHRCEICNKTFKTKNYLTEHKRTHREPEEYSCDKCLKVFGSKSNPRGHIKTKHESTSSYSCEYCSKKFEKAFCLKQHTDSCQNRIAYQLNQRKHSELTCDACGKEGFKTKKSLSDHRRKILNNLEKTLKNIKNKEDLYWVMLKKYENKLYCK